MTDAVIVLDKSKPFSECRGERQTDDPAYRVCYYQGQMVGKDMILLPFDSQGSLVPDDGKTEPWPSKDADGKAIVHYPLYNKPMRELLEKKKKRQAIAVASEPEDDRPTDDDVNFVMWLQGQAKYEWPLLVAAARKRFGRMYQSKGEMVEEMVEDERLIQEAQLGAEQASALADRRKKMAVGNSAPA